MKTAACTHCNYLRNKSLPGTVIKASLSNIGVHQSSDFNMLGIDRIYRTTRNSQSRRKIRPYIRPPATLPWTADKEAIFLSFEKTHVSGTPWPIEARPWASSLGNMTWIVADGHRNLWILRSLQTEQSLRKIPESRRYGILITSPQHVRNEIK